MCEPTPFAEIRFLLLFLSLDRLSSRCEGGLGAYFHGDELEDVLQLYNHLRESVLDMARTEAAAYILAKAEEEADKLLKEE